MELEGGYIHKVSYYSYVQWEGIKNIMAADIHAEVAVAVTPATTAARGDDYKGGMEKEEEVASIVGKIGLGIFTILYAALIYHAGTYVARVLTQAKLCLSIIYEVSLLEKCDYP